MSPFTSDSRIIKEFLSSEHKVWKSLSGEIESISILERKATIKGPTNYWRIQVKTKTFEPSPLTTGVYEVQAIWDFMELKSITVKELSLS